MATTFRPVGRPKRSFSIVLHIFHDVISSSRVRNHARAVSFKWNNTLANIIVLPHLLFVLTRS